uniref:Zinc finger protein 365 n=1 Tax=Molossus molossus TaxID=27622 RepID=A0A7J8DS11_MOLMO|nr:zinc finger protein 365 [Molossus molossus]
MTLRASSAPKPSTDGITSDRARHIYALEQRRLFGLARFCTSLLRSCDVQPLPRSRSREGGSRESSAAGLHRESVAAGGTGGKAVGVLSEPAGRRPLPRRQGARAYRYLFK